MSKILPFSKLILLRTCSIIIIFIIALLFYKDYSMRKAAYSDAEVFANKYHQNVVYNVIHFLNPISEIAHSFSIQLSRMDLSHNSMPFIAMGTLYQTDALDRIVIKENNHQVLYQKIYRLHQDAVKDAQLNINIPQSAFYVSEQISKESVIYDFFDKGYNLIGRSTNKEPFNLPDNNILKPFIKQGWQSCYCQFGRIYLDYYFKASASQPFNERLFLFRVHMGRLDVILNRMSLLDQNRAYVINEHDQVVSDSYIVDSEDIIDFNKNKKYYSLKKINALVKNGDLPYHKIKMIQLGDESVYVCVSPIPQTTMKLKVITVMPLKSYSPNVNMIDLTDSTFILFFIVLLILFLYFQSFQVSNPLISIQNELDKLICFQCDGRINMRTPIQEIKQIVVKIEKLQSIMRGLTRFVQYDFIKHFSEENKDFKVFGNLQKITLYYGIIPDTTKLLNLLDQKRFVAYLNNYFNVSSQMITDRSGYVGSMLGSGLFAFWRNEDNSDSKELEKACITAIAVQQRLCHLNKYLHHYHREVMDIHIGLHHCDMTFCLIGSDQYMQATPIGPNLGLIYDLADLNKVYGTKILVTESVRALLSDDFIVRRVDQIKHEQYGIMQLYDLVGVQNTEGIEPLSAQQLIFIERYEKALDLYDQQKWQIAYDAFALLKQDQENEGIHDLLVVFYLHKIKEISNACAWHRDQIQN